MLGAELAPRDAEPDREADARLLRRLLELAAGALPRRDRDSTESDSSSETIQRFVFFALRLVGDAMRTGWTRGGS